MKNDCCGPVASFFSEIKVCFYFFFPSYWQSVSNTPYTTLLKNEKNVSFSIYKAKIGEDRLWAKKISCIFLEISAVLLLLMCNEEVYTK